MTTFELDILLHLLPAYVFVGGGYIARRCCRLPQHWVAKSLFYIFVPLVVFKGALFSNVWPFLLLAALSFSVSVLMVAAAGFIAKRFENLLAPGTLKCAFGYFNIGWFGIPIVHALYGDQGSIAMTALYIGGMLFGNTVGFVLVTTDGAEKAGRLRKLLHVPSLYCAALAFAAHGLGFRQALMESDALVSVLNGATLMTSVFGMALVGMSVSNIAAREVPWRQLSALLGTRMLCASLIVGALAEFLNVLSFFKPVELRVFLLMPLLPIAANILVFTSTRRNENEFVGVSLLASTMLSCALLVGWFMLSGKG
jgi:predicted permease